MSLPNNHVKLVGRVRVGPKGQVVIPMEVRQQLNIQPGAHLLALYIADSGAVAFLPESNIQQLINRTSGELAASLQQLGSDSRDR